MTPKDYLNLIIPERLSEKRSRTLASIYQLLVKLIGRLCCEKGSKGKCFML